MELLNLLNVGIPIYVETASVDLNLIGRIIKALVYGVGSVGVGIILFSLILKLITLPFDVYQRISMRKQNLKMKENQARMEKLQKQYANDKDMYNQKVMEMYKENGLSTFSSCLPMILSMIIFFVAINAFNAYASFANVENYNVMVTAYNEALLPYVADFEESNYKYQITEQRDESDTTKVTGITVTYTLADSASADKFISCVITYEAKADGETGEFVYPTSFEDAKPLLEKWKSNDFSEYASSKVNFYVDTDRAYEYQSEEGKTAIDDAVTAKKAEAEETGTPWTDQAAAEAKNDAVVAYLKDGAQTAVLTAYNEKVEKKAGFLWIKNIWATDAAYKHPVLKYSDFANEIVKKSSCSCGKGDESIKSIGAYTEEGYTNVTNKLGAQKSEANGYFILIALSIGTILLQQFVSMRSQKEQQKYSTVDGQSGGQQKMMMVMMTAMFAIFSFMYSSAFSIYLVVSNLFSLLSTLVINKVVDKVAEKKEEKAERAKYERRFAGRAQAAVSGKKDAKVKKVKEIKTDADDKKKK